MRLDFRQTKTIRLLRALVEARDAVMAQGEAQIRRHGLSPCEFDGLVTLGVAEQEAPPGGSGALRMGDLARRSLLTKSYTTQVVKQLAARGLVRRERSPESEREVLVSLTPAGRELFERVYPAHYEFLGRLFRSRLTEEEMEALTRMLRKLADGE